MRVSDQHSAARDPGRETEYGQEDGENSALHTDDQLFAELVRLVLWPAGADGWAQVEDGFWFSVQPPDRQPRAQGWKIHLSATPLSAALVTVRAAEVLVGEGCAVKVAIGFAPAAGAHLGQL